MARGQISIFDSIFTPAPSSSPKEGKKERQTTAFYVMIAYRYYYYAEIKKFRLDYCLDQLGTEAFRSPETIIDILRDARDLVKDIVQAQPSIRELRAKYPWLLWES